MTSTPPPAPPGPPRAADPVGSRFFDRMRSRPLRRPAGRPVGGVCAAIADHYGIDRVLARVAVVIVAVVLNPLIPFILVGYAAGWVLIPDTSGQILAENGLRGRWTWPLAGAIVLGLLGLATLDDTPGPDIGVNGGWLVLLILGTLALALYLLRGRDCRPGAAAPAPWAPPAAGHPAPSAPAGPVTDATGPADPAGGDDEATVSLTKRARTPQPSDTDSAMLTTAPASPSWTPSAGHRPPPARGEQAARRPAAGAPAFALVAGLTLLVTGGVLTAGVLGVLPDPFTTALVAAIAALTTVAVAIIVVGLAGRRAGALSVIAVLAVSGLLSASVAHTGRQYWQSGTGAWQTLTWTPQGQIVQPHTYSADYGDRVLDLSRVQELADGQSPSTLTMEVSLGQATVLVPEDLTVDLDLAVDLGGIDLPGESVDSGDGGSAAVTRTLGGGPADLTVVARVDVGQITVRQAPLRVEAPAPAPASVPTVPQTRQPTLEHTP